MRLSSIGLLVSATALLAACSMGQARDAGPRTTRSYPVTNFSKLDVAGSYDVTVSTGSQPGVQATGGQNRLEDLVVEQVGDTLRIHPKTHTGISFGWTNDRGIKVSVTVPAVSDLNMAGSGNVTVTRVSGDRFAAALAGSGDLRLDAIQARNLEISIAGSGDVSAKGTAGATKLSIAGSGGVDGGGLTTDTAEVSVMGSGDVRLQA